MLGSTVEMLFRDGVHRVFGHIFIENGVRLSDSRVQGIRDFPEPTSVKSVRSFIWIVSTKAIG